MSSKGKAERARTRMALKALATGDVSLYAKATGRPSPPVRKPRRPASPRPMSLLEYAQSKPPQGVQNTAMFAALQRAGGPLLQHPLGGGSL